MSLTYYYLKFVIRYIDIKYRRNQLLALVVGLILLLRLYQANSDLTLMGYDIFGAILTYIAAGVFIGAIDDLVKEAKALDAENKTEESTGKE